MSKKAFATHNWPPLTLWEQYLQIGKKSNLSKIKQQEQPSYQYKQRQSDTWYPLQRVTKKTNWPQLPRVHCSKQYTHFQKNKHIKINSVDDQEPIARRTRFRSSTGQLQPTQLIQKKSEPIAQRTRSKKFAQKHTTPSHSRSLDTQFITHMTNSVLEQETGKQLNYRQLRKHPRLQETRNKSFSMRWEDYA